MNAAFQYFQQAKTRQKAMLRNFQSKLLIHKPMLKNLQNKLLTLLVLSTVLPVSVVGLYGISSSSNALTELNINRIESELDQHALRIEQALSNVYQDVVMISKVPPIQGIVRARESSGVDLSESTYLTRTTYKDWQKRAEVVFRAMMSAKLQYKTIQYLDENGNELVRLDKKDGKLFSHPANDNENFTNAVYFQPVLDLRSEQVYISPIVLEQNSIPGQSVEAVIYYGTPIYNNLGKKRGMIIMTLYVKSLLAQLEAANDDFQKKALLVTKDGDYLVHPNLDHLWKKKNSSLTNLRNEYPSAIVNQILNDDRGTLQINTERIISYRVINPGSSYEMTVIFDLPKNAVLQSVSELKRLSLGVILLSLGCVLAVGISIVRRISKAETTLYQHAQLAAQTAEDKARELEQTLHELHHTQTQLIQTEKMSSLGQLVAGVAHEINNPVNFIYGNISHVDEYSLNLLRLIRLYQQNYPNPTSTIRTEIETIDLDFVMEDLPKILESMKVGADRIRQIVLSLRNFSRLDESEMKVADIHEGIESTLLILQHCTKPNGDFPGVKIVKQYGNLPVIDCYPGQLNQVFMNLLSNAIDALEETAEKRQNNAWQPQITITTEYLPPQNPFNGHSHSLTTDSNPVTPAIRIRIADNGMGIPSTIKNRLFEPFFTTKPIGKGTGLGLSISYQIVTERHGGKLNCISEAGKGTEFWIEIPMRQQVASAHSMPAIK